MLLCWLHRPVGRARVRVSRPAPGLWDEHGAGAPLASCARLPHPASGLPGSGRLEAGPGAGPEAGPAVSGGLGRPRALPAGNKGSGRTAAAYSARLQDFTSASLAWSRAPWSLPPVSRPPAAAAGWVSSPPTPRGRLRRVPAGCGARGSPPVRPSRAQPRTACARG